MQTLIETAARLGAGTLTSRALVEECLARIEDPVGEGKHVFRVVYTAKARAMADAIDAARRAGYAPGPYAGIPISLKDLLDVAGEPTPAGSRVLDHAAPATKNAPIVDRLLAAGLIPIGRSNMTEFAYSGLGINPHYGTPLSPWDRASRHVPGGSSSGAAASVAYGMALAGIGTDTGGSCRVPAAFCGVVGFKPTARRVPTEGALPLSTSLDSIGPFTSSVADAAIIDAILAAQSPEVLAPRPLEGLRFVVPAPFALEGMDTNVAAAFNAAIAMLRAAGVRIEERNFGALRHFPPVTHHGGITGAEASHWHRKLLAEHADLYDPFVRRCLAQGSRQSAADYIALLAERAAMIREMGDETTWIDALVMPTSVIVPPRFSEVEDAADHDRINLLVLRNTMLVNIIDWTAISLPIGTRNGPPVGLMLAARTMEDRSRLLPIAAGVEAALLRGC
ncbi:MAG: amidase [Acetobacteraceae bacterium]